MNIWIFAPPIINAGYASVMMLNEVHVIKSDHNSEHGAEETDFNTAKTY